MEVGAHLGPGNRCHAAGSIVRHPSLDLGRPRLLDISVGRFFDALEQSSRKLRPIIGRQFGCLLEEFFDRSRHERMLRHAAGGGS